MKYVHDEARKYALNAITKRISRKQSVMLTGHYGSGKTSLLKQIKNTATTVRVRSLGSLYQLLGRIDGVNDPVPYYKAKYLDHRCAHPATIIIDEAQHLPHSLYPYLKIIMDSGSSVILAGLPELRQTLVDKHPDVLSRLTHIELEPLAEQDLYAHLGADFEEDAFSAIYGSTGDMRVMMSIVQDCRDYAEAKGVNSIGMDLVSMFIRDDN
jgi:predicted AAA+ superfamily ATPase